MFTIMNLDIVTFIYPDNGVMELVLQTIEIQTKFVKL